MLNQVVIDMANQLIEAKKQVAVSIADEKRLAKQAEQEAANAAEWERRAMLAIKAGDDAPRQGGADPQEGARPARAPLQGAVAEAEAGRRPAQDGAAHAQQQDRGGEAQEERPHRPEEAGRSAEGHPGDDERPEQRLGLRDVRPHGRTRSIRSRPRPRPRPGDRRAVHGRHAGAPVRAARGDGRRATTSCSRSSARWACSRPEPPPVAPPARRCARRRGDAPRRSGSRRRSRTSWPPRSRSSRPKKQREQARMKR